jgi:hypothetical protein
MCVLVVRGEWIQHQPFRPTRLKRLRNGDSRNSQDRVQTRLLLASCLRLSGKQCFNLLGLYRRRERDERVPDYVGEVLARERRRRDRSSRSTSFRGYNRTGPRLRRHQRFGSRRKLRHTHTERPCELQDVGQTRVTFASLDSRHVDTVEVGQFEPAVLARCLAPCAAREAPNRRRGEPVSEVLPPPDAACVDG